MCPGPSLITARERRQRLALTLFMVSFSPRSQPPNVFWRRGREKQSKARSEWGYLCDINSILFPRRVRYLSNPKQRRLLSVVRIA